MASGQHAAAAYETIPRPTLPGDEFMLESVVDVLARHSPADGPVGEPPPELVAAYAELYSWGYEHPEQAAEIKAMTEDQIAAIVSGIAWAAEFNHTESECRTAADIISTWAVYNGFLYLFDWEGPIALKTQAEIIELINADREAGLIPNPKAK
jgi:hypothetical protein